MLSRNAARPQKIAEPVMTVANREWHEMDQLMAAGGKVPGGTDCMLKRTADVQQNFDGAP
jgi:hypothetical protein